MWAWATWLCQAVLGVALCLPLTAESSAQEYKLGPGDRVRVVVLSDTELSGEYQVDGAGMISPRMVGRFSVNGMTTAELETTLMEKYRSTGVLRNPRLSVELLNARPFYVLGEVSRPGSYPYVSGLTVAQAVAIAGGYTRRASTSRIKIKRFANPTVEEAVTEDSMVQPGDVLRVRERFF